MGGDETQGQAAFAVGRMFALHLEANDAGLGLAKKMCEAAASPSLIVTHNTDHWRRNRGWFWNSRGRG